MRNAQILVLIPVATALMTAPALAQRVGGTGGGGILDRPGFHTQNNFNPADDRDPFNRGMTAFDAGDYILAERVFSEVLSLSPNDATVLVLHGMTYSARGQWRQATPDLAHALRVDRDNLDAHRELGIAKAKLGDAKAANTELASLQALKAKCAGVCTDAAKLDRAVDAVQVAIAEGPAAKK